MIQKFRLRRKLKYSAAQERLSVLKRQESKLYTKNGAILILTLWVMMIITVLAVGLAFRMRIEIRMTQIFIAKTEIVEIAKSALYRALGESINDLEPVGEEEAQGGDVFSYNLSWAVNTDLYKDIELGRGRFDIRFEYELSEDENQKEIFYGLKDEQSLINLNFVASMKDKRKAKRIIKSILGPDVDQDEKTLVAGAIIDWVDKSEEDGGLSEVSIGGAEDSFYASLSPAYQARDGLLKTVEELKFVRGVTDEIYERLKKYVTVYGKGSTNINTAPREVLLALGNLGESFVDAMLDWRLGEDGRMGTDDDGIFTSLQDIEVNLGYPSGSIAALDELRQTKTVSKEAEDQGLEAAQLIGVTSDVFRVHIFASLENSPVTKELDVVFQRERPEPGEENSIEKYRILYWFEK
ncbi:general secretion pathway protein GspK [PVC group bacterium]|nr:general secretion pathway protein GspK [PVC group bacterium]